MTATSTSTRPPKGKKLTGDARTAFVAEITTMYLGGASVRDIADQTGRAYGSIHRMLTENDVTLRARGGANRKTTP
jgi:Helix-turn-helix domain